MYNIKVMNELRIFIFILFWLMSSILLSKTCY